jgi:hypothetical protein
MPTHRHLASLATLVLLAATCLPPLARAQASAGAPAAAVVRASDPAIEPGRSNQTIERIRTEDGGSRIDELRVGGQTQSILVQPKGDMPAYEIKPADARGGPSQGGVRMWNFLRF